MKPILTRILFTAVRYLCSTALLTQITQAQNSGYLTDSNTSGLAPSNSFQSGDIDYLNLGNGALNLHIPLVERKGRGLDSGAFLTYSSKIWSVTPIWDGLSPHTLVQVNWNYAPEVYLPWVRFAVIGAGGAGSNNVIGAGRLTYNENSADCTVGSTQYSDTVDYGFVYYTADGAGYQFPNRHVTSYPPGSPHCIKGTSNIDVGSSDNAAFELDTATTPYTVHYKDGRTQADLGPLKDTNGNYFDTNGDTLKRTMSITGIVTTFLQCLTQMGIVRPGRSKRLARSRQPRNFQPQTAVSRFINIQLEWEEPPRSLFPAAVLTSLRMTRHSTKSRT